MTQSSRVHNTATQPKQEIYFYSNAEDRIQELRYTDYFMGKKKTTMRDNLVKTLFVNDKCEYCEYWLVPQAGT